MLVVGDTWTVAIGDASVAEEPTSGRPMGELVSEIPFLKYVKEQDGV